MIPRLSPDSYKFPNPRKAQDSGLLAWGGDLGAYRLLAAYREGVFPWYNEGNPILWWSPNPRLILYPRDLKVSKSLKKSIKKYETKCNTNFRSVITACKEVRADTWISQEMLEAYVSLHEMGHALSVETYNQDELVGGLYGVMVGSVFCGESMFSTQRDASKVALSKLCEMLIEANADFIDAQMPTDHLLSLGAKPMERDLFLDKLATCRDKEILSLFD